MRTSPAPRVVAILGLLAACVGTREAPPVSSAEQAMQRAAAGFQRLEEGKVADALSAFEQGIALDPMNGHAHLGRALALEALASRTAGPGGPASVPVDPESDFARARRLLPADPRPRLGLARVAFRRGELEEAAERALEAGALAEARGDASVRFDACRLLAEATIGRLGASPDATTLASLRRRADEALAACVALEPARAEVYLLGADLAAACGDAEGALARLRAGVAACPECAPLHDRLVDSHSSASPPSLGALVEAYDAYAAANPQSAATRWTLGRAQRLLADEKRRSESWEAALSAYQAAAASFEAAATLDPTRREAALDASALAGASRGWCRLGQSDLAAAERLFLDAFEERPALLDTPDGAGKTLREAIDVVADAWANAEENDRARDLLEKATALAPGVGGWHRRLGVLCRRTGIAAETAREAAKAASLFERAYAAFRAALALSPEDPRLLNECALVLLLHLGRDTERAEAMFREAIALGERRLLDSALASEERDALSEAVGDACENLGVLYHDRKNDPAGARPFFEKSLRHAPHPRPKVRWYLAKIEEGAAGAAPASAGVPR